jgi:hypothetical protein
MLWLAQSSSKCFLLAVCGAILQISAATPSQDAGKAILRGMVVDHTGAVVQGVGVEISAREKNGGSQHGAQVVPNKLETDAQGQFSVALPPGSYQLCVSRFPNSCRLVVLKTEVAPEYLVLNIKPWEEVNDPTLPESRFQKIAGPSAQNCGHVQVNEDRRPATACAMSALQQRRPFYVIYDEMGVDSYVVQGMAWNAIGEPYLVEYDSMGIGSYPLPPRDTMPDGSHTIVTPCSLPLRLYINDQGEPDCFNHKELLQQYMEAGNYREVGDSGYKEFIPALKKRLFDPEVLDDPDQQQDIKLALAKLGDREQQQALVCQLLQGDPKEIEALVQEDVPYVRGWFAVRFYRAMLAPVLESGSSTNSGSTGKARLALMALARVYEGPSTKVGADSSPDQVREYARQWMAWITKNEKALKYPPSGKGVDFSGRSCRK